MAQAGGAPGADPWCTELRRLIDEAPEPQDLPTAIGPLAQLGVDVAAALDKVDRYLSLPEADWDRDDWRHTHPEFPPQYAGVVYMYTDEGLGIYRVLGAAMHDTARRADSPSMRACLPSIKLLDVALVEAAIVWGFFEGQTLRGVKHAFPQPTVADHDPQRHFPAGREFHWFEFNSSATNSQVMYKGYFCGKRGPRTIFTIQSCEGVSIKKFSAIPDEEEVLFRPLARFRVTSCTKMLTEGDLRDDVHPNNGFPDSVHLQQLPTFDPMAVLRARAAQFRQQAQEAEQALIDATRRSCFNHSALLKLLGRDPGAIPEDIPGVEGPPDDVPTTGRRDPNFACLDELESCRGVDGKLELRMTWPGTALKANHWKQISNPYEKRSQGVDGYEAIDCPYTGLGWGGIEAGSAKSLINGSATKTKWYCYALGTYAAHVFKNGAVATTSPIPGPAKTGENKCTMVKCAELHVKRAGSWLVVMRQTTGTDFGRDGWWKPDWFRTLPAGALPLPASSGEQEPEPEA